MTEAFGALYFALNVVGNAGLIWKWRASWLVRIAAILMQGAYAIAQHSPTLGANAATFLVVNVVGWLKWRKQEMKEAPSAPTKKEG